MKSEMEQKQAEANATGSGTKPRVIVEMNANGSLSLRSWSNGQESVIPLNRGQEYWEILDALKRQQREIDRKKEEHLQKQSNAEAALHRRVWQNTAEMHGVAFANRTIGAKNIKPFGYYLERQEDKAKPKADKPANSGQATNLDDLF